MLRIVPWVMVVVVTAASFGCLGRRGSHSPVAAGLNTRDLYDLPAQADADRAFAPILTGQRTGLNRSNPSPRVNGRNVLCLSGGGAYGAYSAGVVCGWTCRGDRPQFDVVTGISTGALIAPFAFLGSACDQTLERFYTTLTKSDVYRLRPVRGFVSESFADNTPLARTLDKVVTDDMVRAIAAEHDRGRRLYVGTTEVEGRRFVVWDIGAIARRDPAGSRSLIVQILLGSSAIPGFFGSQSIPVTIDGKSYVERHVDGGVSQSLFFRPPSIPPGSPPSAELLQGTNVYVIVAGKLYMDPEPVKPRALKVATQTTEAVLYAQCRGDLTRLWTVCQLAGMNFHVTAIPSDFPAPKMSTDFDPPTLRAMFDEGLRQIQAGAWRTSPPGTQPGEEVLVREGTDLNWAPRVPIPERSGFPFVTPKDAR
jgi:hypothetical protein